LTTEAIDHLKLQARLTELQAKQSALERKRQELIAAEQPLPPDEFFELPQEEMRECINIIRALRRMSEISDYDPDGLARWIVRTLPMPGPGDIGLETAYETVQTRIIAAALADAFAAGRAAERAC
jgi:hypothetical protein